MKKNPEWFDEYTRGPPVVDTDPEVRKVSLAWLANLPPAVRDMVRQFPPNCLVKATRPLGFPGPGDLGIVISYREPSTEYPRGTVLVRRHTISKGRNELDAAHCSLDWLEVVGFDRGANHDVVEVLIAEALRVHQKDN